MLPITITWLYLDRNRNDLNKKLSIGSRELHSGGFSVKFYIELHVNKLVLSAVFNVHSPDLAVTGLALALVVGVVPLPLAFPEQTSRILIINFLEAV